MPVPILGGGYVNLEKSMIPTSKQNTITIPLSKKRERSLAVSTHMKDKCGLLETMKGTQTLFLPQYFVLNIPT